MIAEGKQKYLKAPNEHFGSVLKYFFEKIKKEFDAQKIGIPYPQIELHVNRGEGG